MTKDQRRSVCGNRFFVFGLSSSVFRHSSNNKTRPLVQGRGARSRCHPGLPKPHGPSLNGLRRPSLVTGGAGLDLPPTRRASARMRSHRLGSAPQLRSVFPRGRRRHLQRLPLSGLRSQPRTLSINAFWEDVRMWRGGYHGPRDVSRQILAESFMTTEVAPEEPSVGRLPAPTRGVAASPQVRSESTSLRASGLRAGSGPNDTGPQRDTPRMPICGPGLSPNTFA
jgi:hypothetical protein